MQSPFKYFLKKHKENIYFYIWVSLTIVDAIYLAISLALSIIDESKGAFYARCSTILAFCAFGIFTVILSYLKEKG
jgi:hypothetical protein